jgi:hypothetical protein
MLDTQIAPTYLSSCLNQGLGLLEILLLKQPMQDNRQVLKVCLFDFVFPFCVSVSFICHLKLVSVSRLWNFVVCMNWRMLVQTS